MSESDRRVEYSSGVSEPAPQNSEYSFIMNPKEYSLTQFALTVFGQDHEIPADNYFTPSPNQVDELGNPLQEGWVRVEGAADPDSNWFDFNQYKQQLLNEAEELAKNYQSPDEYFLPVMIARGTPVHVASRFEPQDLPLPRRDNSSPRR